MSAFLDRLKKEDILKKQERDRNIKQNNLKLNKEYKFKLNDNKVHNFVPVQTYNNGQYIGVIVDNSRYALISADKFNELINKNKALNKDIEERPVKTVENNYLHDRTNNKQEVSAPEKTEMVYSSITVYDTSDDGDRYMSESVPVRMDNKGNIYTVHGQKFSLSLEEINLDLKNDTSIFYEDWMHARGEPITYIDKVSDGIEPEVASKTAEGQTVPSGLKAMREEASREQITFSTKNYSDKEIEEELETMDITRDERWETT